MTTSSSDGHVLSSDNVRQQPPIRRGVFGGPSSSVKLLVAWKNRPVKISPFANVAVMEPETLPEPAQLDFAEFVPDTAAPEPVLTMAQPTISPTTNRNPTPKAI
jgi:hypothetical protein